MKTLSSPILVPPPRPPRTRNATAGAEPWRESRRNRSMRPRSFAADVMLEVRHVVWPARAQVCAASLVTIGLLVFLTAYIQGLNMMTDWLFSVLRIGAR